MYALPPSSRSASWTGNLAVLGAKIRTALKTLVGLDRGVAPTKRMADVPQASVDDVVKTLSVPRFRLFGLSFGGMKKISDLQLWTDASGLGLGATALVDGHPTAIKGDLLARLVDRQFAQLEQKKRAQAAFEASRPKPASPQPTPKASLPGSGVASPNLSASSWSTDPALLFEADWQDVAGTGARTPASSVHSMQEAAEAAPDEWAVYCQQAGKKGVFATRAEIIATAQVLQQNIRVISRFAAKGDPNKTLTFSVEDFNGNPSKAQPDYTVVLSTTAPPHYEPVAPQIAQDGGRLTKEALNTVEEASEVAAADGALRALTGTATRDGSCFFYAIATLYLGFDPQKLDEETIKIIEDAGFDLRQQAVAFLKDHGKTFKVPLNGVLPEERIPTLEQIALGTY